MYTERGDTTIPEKVSSEYTRYVRVTSSSRQIADRGDDRFVSPGERFYFATHSPRVHVDSLVRIIQSLPVGLAVIHMFRNNLRDYINDEYKSRYSLLLLIKLYIFITFSM